MKHLFKILGRILLIILALVMLLWLMIQTETVQNFVIKRVTNKISKDLHTEVHIGHISLSLFNKLNLDDVLIKDQKKDTILAAKALRVRITDWFFLRDRADLKYLGIENARIKLNRTDSIWNFKFLVDYFASSNTEKKKNNKSIQLHLKKIDLVNVHFTKIDKWNGQDMDISFGTLSTDIAASNLSKSIFDINSIDIEKMRFTISDYHALRPKRPKTQQKATNSFYFNKNDIQIKVADLNIRNSYFADVPDLKGRKPYTHFDTRHMIFSNINTQIKNFSFVKDTIRANIDLQAQERSGIKLKKLKALFKLTPQKMEFTKFELQTNKSRLTDFLSFNFKDFSRDFGEFEDSIYIKGHFINSIVHTDDIHLLTGGLKEWNKRMEVAMNFDGFVRDFQTKNMHVKLDNHTFVNADLSMQGFPNFDTAHMNFEHLFVQMTKLEATPIIPAFKSLTSPDFDAMGVIQYKGNFNGTMHDFVSAGSLNSAIGGFYIDARLIIPNGQDPIYKGKINTQNFNLGRFIHSSFIGKVNFKGNFDGKSFSLPTASSTLNGIFSTAEVNGYNYHNIDVNGSIRKKYFIGNVRINDNNANVIGNVKIDMNGEAPQFNILGDVVNADLQKLNFFKQQLILTGLFDLNFSGHNIDDYVGSAKILNAEIQKDSLSLAFDSLAVNAYYNSQKEKTLSIESNDFNVSIEGKYKILDLPNSFQAFLHQYYPSIIKEPSKSPKDQNFTININTYNIGDYTKIFLPQVSGLDSAVFTGSINTLDSNYFYMHANVPEFKIKHYKFEKIDLEGRGNFKTLNLTGNIGTTHTSDSFYFPSSSLSITSEQDHSVIALKTKANTTLNDAQLNADVYTLSDGVKINFRPSSFILNDKTWNLEKQGEIVIRKNLTSAQNVRFSQGLQQLTVETVAGEKDLQIKLQNISLGDVTPLFVKNPRMDGLANGTIYMHNFFGAFNIDGELQAEQFRLNDDSIGLVNINANFDKITKLVNYKILSDNPKHQFGINGTFNVNDSIQHPLDAEIDLKDTKIAILNDLLSSLFSNVTGQSSGKLHITGSFGKPAITGNALIKDADLTVNYTKVKYHIDSTNIIFNPDNIDLGNLIIKDRFNNIGTVTGKIYEEALENMRFDLQINTPKLLALNTDAADNAQFYGTAIAKGQFSITGPQENMQMNIIATAADSSHIYIPLSNRNSTSNDFIVYKQYGTELKKPKSSSQLDINLDLTANNLVQIDVILDPRTGDIIKAVGNGKLQIDVPAEGNISMKGKYSIERGKYDFTFQSIVTKPFIFPEGANNYIEWTGSPYDANIHLSANYVATHVSLNDLVSSQSGSSIGGNVRGYRGDVYVIADLSGKLTHPDIHFRLDFPTGSTIKTDPEFNLFLSRIQSDDNEMLKQVAYLIAFGSFAPYGENNAATNFASVGVNTISSILTSEVNKILSNVLYKITGDRSLQFDLNTSTYSSSSWYGVNATQSKLDRQAVNLKINKSLLNGNIIVTVGGDLDFNLAGTSTSGNFQWLPDLSVQIILSKDRKLRAIVFNRSSLDVGTSANSGVGRRNRQGVSISYSKDFEYLFGIKPKQARIDSTKTINNTTLP